MYLEALCLLFGFWSTLSLGENVPVITTEQGKLSGISEEAYDGTPFNSYYAIPFAQPPLGELRFKRLNELVQTELLIQPILTNLSERDELGDGTRDPQPPSTWTGVRKRSSLASPCVQVPFGHMLAGVKLPPEELVGDEDCLYLNVFTPKGAQTRDDIPVMVYIHGGGFFAGGAFEYLPHVLLSRDIILVVIQYRLGFLGFLSTEDSIIPGNYGLKDQIAALQWVQKNIKHFGGNPKKVTIFGESAGAASVHYHMFSPKSEG
ncbi:Carboxylesterase 5A [Halocaridina rubra]|uniref:Carboxylic ester hydrolase n=1 Tax=Halocaridina rubra TaxID=373956 RepID=A0AAN8X2A8_HALRR